MKFEWDRSKNQANVKKHGLDFADAHQYKQNEKAYKNEFGTF